MKDDYNNELINKLENQRDRNRALLKCAVDWIDIMESGNNISSYFLKRNCRKVAIYGAADLGRLLMKLLKNNEIEVTCFIDKAATNKKSQYDIPVYLPDDLPQIDPVDVIVITPVFFFEEIREKLLRVDIAIPVVSLTTIMNECLGEIWYEQQCGTT